MLIFGRAILVFSDFLFKHVRAKKKGKKVGKKREKRKYGTAEEKAAGSHLREIHLELALGAKYDAGEERKT